MAEPRITIVINGKTYSLCSDNADALNQMPREDRRHLITLLEALKYQNRPALAATPTRMGTGDIDALMTRLAVEEKRSRKPVLTRTGIYKVTGGFLLLVFLLVVIL